MREEGVVHVKWCWSKLSVCLNALTFFPLNPHFREKGQLAKAITAKAELRRIAKSNSIPPLVYLLLVVGRCRSGRAIHQIRL